MREFERWGVVGRGQVGKSPDCGEGQIHGVAFVVGRGMDRAGPTLGGAHRPLRDIARRQQPGLVAAARQTLGLGPTGPGVQGQVFGPTAERIGFFIGIAQDDQGQRVTA